VDKTIRKNM